MAKGIIYVMTTAVNGLVKIGMTQNYQQRMDSLEKNGYCNVTALKRRFAIEVDDYDKKEMMLKTIFERSRIADSELFALNVDLAVQLLSAFEGKQIYPDPEEVTKAKSFNEATEAIEVSKIPNGTYYMAKKVKRYDNRTIHAKMKVEDSKIIVLSGSEICPIKGKGGSEGTLSRRDKAKIKDGVLQQDEEFNTVSMAAVFVLGAASNGWIDWKTKEKNGDPIDIYREHVVIDE